MICKKCGQENSLKANFCCICGEKFSKDATKIEENISPIVELKPKFIGGITAISQIPMFLFFALWGGLAFGGFSLVVLKALSIEVPSWIVISLFGGTFFCVIPFVTYFIKKKSYEKVNYKFYDDKLEYYAGVFSSEKKSINLNNVVDVHLSQGVFQKRFNIGTIILSTPHARYKPGRSKGDVYIPDIPNPDAVYGQVKNLIEKKQLNRAA